jgi:hypothetical protein
LFFKALRFKFSRKFLSREQCFFFGLHEESIPYCWRMDDW